MKKFICILLGLFYACAVFAGPLPKEDVPGPLKPWIDWALHDWKDVDCPFVYNDSVYLGYVIVTLLEAYADIERL